MPDADSNEVANEDIRMNPDTGIREQTQDGPHVANSLQ